MDFDQLYESLPATGWLSKPEAELLWRAVNGTEGPILEVGCYHGRSTCLLAATGRPVYAVDPFMGFDSDDPTGLLTYRAFWLNVVTAGYSVAVTGAGDNAPARSGVTLWKQRIEDWEPWSVGFAYLDGDHTLQGTCDQIVAAIQCDVSAIAVHDVNDSGGGLEVRRACLAMLGPWAERVERLAVWRCE